MILYFYPYRLVQEIQSYLWDILSVKELVFTPCPIPYYLCLAVVFPVHGVGMLSPPESPFRVVYFKGEEGRADSVFCRVSIYFDVETKF